MRKSLPVFLFALFFGLSNCTDPIEISDVFLDVDIRVGSELFDASQTYTINGVAVEFEAVRFFLSDLAATQIAAGETAITDETSFHQPNDDAQFAGTISSGSYDEITINLGVPASKNNADPTQYTRDEALSVEKSPSIHWGWDTGYMFVRIDGFYDSDGDGAVDTDFELHLGKNDYYTPFAVPYSFEAAADEPVTLSLDFDLTMLFDGLDWPSAVDNNTSHTADNIPLTEAIFANVNKAFAAQ
jgi:hypothetical protein